MRKYKFVLLLTVVVAVFFVLSWFVYDGIDIFFSIVYSAPSEKEETVKATTTTPSKTVRTKYSSKEAKPETQTRDDMEAPESRYDKLSSTSYRKSALEKFVVKIFPEQLSYILNPYTFFLLLVLTVLPIIGIFIYLIIFSLK
ncbi:MAG: hypothetical protein RAO94_05765 [Candidatus Stygibacter australis]|nr:hypothetical protein [Candidatus Stygibacter australis]